MPQTSTKTSFKPGQSGNPKGRKEGEPEAYRSRERYIQALMAAATNDELVSDLVLLRSGDKNPLEFHKLYVASVSNMKIYSPEEREEHQAKMTKLRAETKAIEAAGASKVIDEARVQIKIEDLIKQISGG